MTELPVVNASPLIYLAHAGFIDLLQVESETVLVPLVVRIEIGRRGPADPTVRALQRSPWLLDAEAAPVPPQVSAWELGPGETAVIAWALAHQCTAILDDLAARRCAGGLGIPLIGTLGLVLKAKRKGLIRAARPVLEKLRGSGMYLSDRILDPALRLVDE